MLGWTHPHVNWIFRIQLWCNMNSISTTFSFYACVSGPTIDKGTLCTRRTVVAWVSVRRGAWEMNAWISSLLIYIRVWLHVYAPFTTVSKRRADLHRMAVACVYSFMIARFVCTITSVRFFWLGVPMYLVKWYCRGVWNICFHVNCCCTSISYMESWVKYATTFLSQK